MRWLIYNFFFSVGYILMLPKFFIRMKKRGGYRAHFSERFGRFEPDVAARLSEKPRMWIHAVSVGEANLAGVIIKEMRRRDPGFSCILSTTSSTGRAECEKIASENDIVIYLPIDFPVCVHRALSVVNAKEFVVIETEFWPNIIRALHAKNVPIVLANGRVSDRSFRGYEKLRFFLGPMFECFTRILAQSALDRERLIKIGAPAAKIEITGSVKFDVTPPSGGKIAQAKATLAVGGIEPGRDLVLLGGSTWPGEEAMLLKAWRAAVKTAPELRLALCPRHKERGGEVAAELEKLGAKVIRRSLVSEPPADAASGEPPVLLVDTTGELFALYSQSDIVFVGKTMPPNSGGQNMIEPASFGKAVICGPDTSNFKPVMAKFRADESIAEARDSAALVETVCRLAGDRAAREDLGVRADRTVNASRGALSRTADALEAPFSA